MLSLSLLLLGVWGEEGGLADWFSRARACVPSATKSNDELTLHIRVNALPPIAQLDGLLFPSTQEGGPPSRISVARADFSYKEEGANVHEGLGFDDHVRLCVCVCMCMYLSLDGFGGFVRAGGIGMDG